MVHCFHVSGGQLSGRLENILNWLL